MLQVDCNVITFWCQTQLWTEHRGRKGMISYSYIYTPAVLNPFINAFGPRLSESSRCWRNLQWLLGALPGSEFRSAEPWMHMDAKTYVWKAHVLRSPNATSQMLPGSFVPGLSENTELLLRSKVRNVCHEGTMRIAWVVYVYVQKICIYQYIDLWMNMCVRVTGGHLLSCVYIYIYHIQCIFIIYILYIYTLCDMHVKTSE